MKESAEDGAENALKGLDVEELHHLLYSTVARGARIRRELKRKVAEEGKRDLWREREGGT